MIRGSGLRHIQLRLERFYALEAAPDVVDFVREGTEGSRERVLVRRVDETVEIAVVLPPGHDSLFTTRDVELQRIEGVSHFVHLAERARTELPTTQLELELQAEVDKFVVLAIAGDADPVSARRIHRTLYEDARHLYAPESVKGRRYRLATRLAAKLSRRLIATRSRTIARQTLRRFYRAGQGDKIRMAVG